MICSHLRCCCLIKHVGKRTATSWPFSVAFAPVLPEPVTTNNWLWTAVERDGRSRRLSNLRGGNSSRLLAPQGAAQECAVADFPSVNELDAANGVVTEDAAIEINRKLVVDSLKVSLQP